MRWEKVLPVCENPCLFDAQTEMHVLMDTFAGCNVFFIINVQSVDLTT